MPGRWLRGFEVDLRSLALFRIALGLVLLADLLIRIPMLDDFYTDRGVLPREALLSLFGTRWTISLHLISGEWAVQLILFLIAALFALGFTVGYRTRLCAVVSWVLLVSMHERNPAVLHGGDAFLRVVLFWCMFATLNARFSLDRALNPSRPPLPVRDLSPASLALVLQICGIYWYAASEKMHPIWLTERSAIYYALMLDQFATPLGKFLLGYPEILRLMTTGTLLLEFVGPILVISPFFTGPLRLLVVASFIGFHAGLGLTMRLDLFPWVCAAAWLVFLPTMYWDILERRLVRWSGSGTTIFFDADCGFCQKAVLILRRALFLPNTQVREAQSDPQIHALMRTRNSWLIRDPEDRVHSGYGGFVELTRRSAIGRWFAPLLELGPARRLGERAYRWVAVHRTIAARHLESVTPPPPRAPGVVMSLLVLSCLVLVTISFIGAQPTKKALAGRILSLTNLGQSWKMFAPFPSQADGWYVMEGITTDGTRFDLWNGAGQPTDAKPPDFAGAFPNTQWLAYLGSLGAEKFRERRPYFGRYLCRRWNRTHSGAEQIILVHLNLMTEFTPPPGMPETPPTKDLMWQQPCPA